MRQIRLFLSLGMLLVIVAEVQAQNSDTTYKQLEEVVFSVNKWEQKTNEVPNKIIKINLNTAKVWNPQTSADLLAQTGTVFIQKSQLGGGSPMIRGFATN